MLLIWVGGPPRFLGGLFALLFMLSPLIAVYTIALAVSFSRDHIHNGVWAAILMLLPLVITSWIAIGWLFHGVAFQP
jgi:NhaP-type Na+/H+ or K+/H+ antiporter